MFEKSNIFSNFANMRNTLPEIIEQNKSLRQLLLAQEGGIMKYLAEHLDANGTAKLFSDYQELCAEIFFERNKWDLNKTWEGDDMKKAALGYEHLSKEVQYQTALKCALSEMPSEVVEIVEDFNEQYLTYAYNQNRKRWYPNGMTPQDIYRETIGLYRGNGFAWRCMNIILKEYHAKGHVVKTTSGIYTEFQIRQYVKQLTHGIFSQLRQAVAEMLEGKTNEQCRQMAISTLKSVRAFSQMIYCDEMVAHSRDVGLYDYANQREVDGKWLQDVADNAMFKEFAAKVKKHSMQFYFAYFISLLKDLGRIWAAQLLVRGIDMQDMEEEECCILQPSDSHLYYVDKYYTDDLPTQFCVADNYQADSLLKGMGHGRNIECILRVKDKAMEAETKNKLSKAYIILVEENFVDKEVISQEDFINVLMYGKDFKIVWKNDPTHKFLKTIISIFLGKSKDYPYSAILEVNNKGKQWGFVKQHFIDENGKKIDIKSNSTKIGKKDVTQLNRILKEIYRYPPLIK